LNVPISLTTDQQHREDGRRTSADHGGGKRRKATKHSAEKIYTKVKIIRFSAATDFCMTSSAPFAHWQGAFCNTRLQRST
jgi:hypothetical protein